MGTGHNGGGPDPVLTDELVLQAMEAAQGIKLVAAKSLGVARSTLYRYIANNPHLATELQEVEEKTLDIVEGKMMNAINRGDGQMIRFFMERKGRKRGYGASRELSGPDGGPIPHQHQTINDEMDQKQAADAYAATLNNSED